MIHLLAPTEHKLHEHFTSTTDRWQVSSLPERHGCDIVSLTGRGMVGYQRKTLSDLQASLLDGRLVSRTCLSYRRRHPSPTHSSSSSPSYDEPSTEPSLTPPSLSTALEASLQSLEQTAYAISQLVPPEIPHDAFVESQRISKMTLQAVSDALSSLRTSGDSSHLSHTPSGSSNPSLESALSRRGLSMSILEEYLSSGQWRWQTLFEYRASVRRPQSHS